MVANSQRDREIYNLQASKCRGPSLVEALGQWSKLTVTVAVATVVTVEVETLVTVEVGIRIPRQSQALEMAEDTVDVSQVGIGGLVCGAGVDDRFAKGRQLSQPVFAREAGKMASLGIDRPLSN